MSPDELVRQRKPDWARLTDLLARAEGGRLATLTETELVTLSRWYRAATSDLALAQRDFPRHNVTVYLNQLVGRAHPLVYCGEPLVLRRVRDFYAREFPQLYRDFAGLVGVAALIFFGLAIVTYLAMLANADHARYVLSPRTIATIRNGTQWWKDLNDANQIGASFVMTNNIGVSFLAFAGGMLLGFGTFLVLVLNGIHLGAVLGLMQVYDHAAPLWEFVIGHGVLELSEITMAGGAGLALAYAVMRPGLLTRRDALVLAAQKAMRLLLGSVPLLIVAGVIEGFLSPSDAPAFIKYAVGIASGVLLYAYLFLGGRQKTAR
ncbi:MAG: stage II sporulation protein M [Chloroflexi bacterium]|nr:stage II sporulation protein M [Chloroflexota bacterium]